MAELSYFLLLAEEYNSLSIMAKVITFLNLENLYIQLFSRTLMAIAGNNNK